MGKYLIILVLVFSLLTVTVCQANVYTDTSGDHTWFNWVNWGTDGIPTATDDAEMSVDGTICNITSSDTIECRGLYVGAYGGNNDMFMSGGDITCKWVNIGRGQDANLVAGVGHFEMTGGTIATDVFKLPEQFSSDSNELTVGTANIYGGTINITGAGLGLGERIHGVFGGGKGTLTMKPGALITLGVGRGQPDVPSATELDIFDDLFNGYITATTDTANASAMIVVDANASVTTISAVDTTAQQARNPVPGSWVTETYTLTSQTTNLDWTSATGVYKEYLYFSDDESLVASKDASVKTDVTSASRPYSVGSLESGKTYYWQIETQIFLSKYDGQIWRLRVPNLVKVDNFDDYTGTWTDSGSAVSTVEDNNGLKYSPDGKNLAITVGAGQSGSASSVPAGSDWTVLNSKALYVDVYGDALNDPNATLTATLNDTASVAYTGSLQDEYDTALNTIITWKIPLADFGINMGNITKMAFTVDNTTGASQAVVHIANLRLVAEECTAEPTADASGDCIVDLDDIAVISTEWLTNGLGLP